MQDYSWIGSLCCQDHDIVLFWILPQQAMCFRVTLSMGAHRALCARCAKSRLFFTTGSHGSQGPEFRTPPHAVLNGSCTLL